MTASERDRLSMLSSQIDDIINLVQLRDWSSDDIPIRELKSLRAKIRSAENSCLSGSVESLETAFSGLLLKEKRLYKAFLICLDISLVEAASRKIRFLDDIAAIRSLTAEEQAEKEEMMAVCVASNRSREEMLADFCKKEKGIG